MHTRSLDDSSDAVDSEDMYTDTSMFDADEIVRHIEMTAAQKKAVLVDTRINARRRAEVLREQKRLEAELNDLDEMSFDE